MHFQTLCLSLHPQGDDVAKDPHELHGAQQARQADDAEGLQTLGVSRAEKTIGKFQDGETVTISWL